MSMPFASPCSMAITRTVAIRRAVLRMDGMASTVSTMTGLHPPLVWMALIFSAFELLIVANL